MKKYWQMELDLVKNNKKEAPSLWPVLFHTLRHYIILSGVLCISESFVKISEAVFLGYVWPI
jgi:hypothetical protein